MYFDNDVFSYSVYRKILTYGEIVVCVFQSMTYGWSLKCRVSSFEGYEQHLFYWMSLWKNINTINTSIQYPICRASDS